jgi:hypothetical protein
MGRFLVTSMLSFAALMLSGCSGGNAPANDAEAKDSTSLSEVGEAYRSYTIAKKKPPQKLGDLLAAEAIGGNGVALAKSGDIVVQWGAVLPDTNEEPGGTSSLEILAYGKAVPEQGGFVLLLDRTVKKMTAEEFKAAPKAGGGK